MTHGIKIDTARVPAWLTGACSIAFAQNVKITPLGSHAGELCGRDRATIFEDPTGVRIPSISRRCGPPTTIRATRAPGRSGTQGARLGQRERDARPARRLRDPLHQWLTLYLPGDTGMHAEMKSVVGDHFRANLRVLNLGPRACRRRTRRTSPMCSSGPSRSSGRTSTRAPLQPASCDQFTNRGRSPRS